MKKHATKKTAKAAPKKTTKAPFNARQLAELEQIATEVIGEKTLPRTLPDVDTLRTLHDEGNDLLHDLRTVEIALQAGDIEAYAASFASTLRRCNDRLFELLDRLEDAGGGQVVRP